MNTQNNKLINNPESRYPAMFRPATFGFIAVMVAVLSFCTSVSAETYEVIEDGQVYIVESWEVVAPAKKKTPDELDAEIGEKMEKLNTRLNKLADLAMDKKLDLLTEKQEKHLRKQVERSNRANEKLKKSKGFKEMGKKHKFKKDKSNQSDLDFYVEAVAEDDEDYDANALGDISAMIDDMNSLMDETEDELLRLTEIEELKEEAAMMIAAGQDPAEVYTRLEYLMKNSPVTGGFYIAKKVAKIASLVCQILFDVTGCFTQQDVAGFNASTAGAVLAAISGGLEIIAEGLEIKVDYDEGQLSEAGYNCIIQIGYEHAQMMCDINSINGQVVSIQADANSLGDSVDLILGQMQITDQKVDRLIVTTDTIDEKVDVLTQKVDDMNAQMNERFDAMTALLNLRFTYIEQLLCTPHGQRPDLPNK